MTFRHKIIETAYRIHCLDREGKSVHVISKEMGMSEHKIYDYLLDLAEIRFLEKDYKKK